jgi:hypothetical protein
MAQMTASGSPVPGVEWAVRHRPFPGEIECGDLHVVAPFENGVLVGVIDGLGHGREAAIAARAAAAALSLDPGRAVRALIQSCHEALRSTRGAVLSLASINLATGSTTWIGVGNVEAVLFRGGEGGAREQVLPRSGVVGYQLPPLREAAVSIAPSDVLVMVSDGLRHQFIEDAPQAGDLGAYAERMLAAHSRESDDALVLALRYLGASL